MNNDQIKEIALSAGCANNQIRKASEKIYQVAIRIARSCADNKGQLETFAQTGLYRFFPQIELVKALKWAQGKIKAQHSEISNFIAEKQ
jgi:hypothetical protein